MLNVLALVAPPALHRLRAIDLAIVGLYLVGITVFGLRFRKRSGGAPADKSLKSYFLANNTIPWWAIALSVVSAETSTLTIISVPGLAFAGDFGFLQVALGYMVGRVVVALLFLPRYFAGEMLTAYQLIDRRFGPLLHKVTAGLFLLTRAAAEGVRVFAVSIVVGIAIGTQDVLSIAIISALTLLYTFEGGMAAVIWTDVVQMAIYIGGTAVAIFTLGTHVHGGWTAIHTVAGVASKFHWLNFAFNLTQTYTFWAGVIGGAFLTMASHGTDQLMVQRLLAARSLRQSQVALLSSGVVIFLQFAMFLLIGAGLYVFYGQNPGSIVPGLSADRLFPTFIVREMPLGIAGLLVAAILAAAMSNLSAALNSLSSTTVVDFYVRLRPETTDHERAMIAKASTILWALVLFAIAVYSVKAGGKGHVVEIGLSIASVAYGCLLGVFLLGTLTRFANQTGASIGMVCGFALNIWLWQGSFPMHLGPVVVPHIAWTWYVLIGAAVTFAVGALLSLLTPKRAAIGATVAVLLGAPIATRYLNAQLAHGPAAPDFTPVSNLINDAIAQGKLPGAVLLVGHNGHIVFEQAYGNRKLNGEPDLQGAASPAEPMTENTIFDMASLSKNLSTSTSIMQLFERGKLKVDAPVERYLPAFNPEHDPERAKVTIRMLLTHTSGEAPDIKLSDPWGLNRPKKAEGIRRALTTPLAAEPGTIFRYSDINFILLGKIVEKLSGQSLDVYAQQHIFRPLQMRDTRYLPIGKACGTSVIPPYSLRAEGIHKKRYNVPCASGRWRASTLLPRIAPTAHDNEGSPETNPSYDRLLRGTVHDPTTRRMGGVAGHAGVFSTAHDVSLFAQALLDRLAGRPSNFPLKQATLQLMTRPEQPSTVAAATILTRDPDSPTPSLLVTQGTPVRGFGWDINTDFSRPRGAVFPTAAPSQPSSPTPSFGHTGYTGTSLWMDPTSNTYVILLANSVHPREHGSISHLRGDVATAVGEALHLDHYIPTPSTTPTPAYPTVQTGIDVLEHADFAQLKPLAEQNGGTLRLGLLTNQSGLDSHGRRTVDVLAHQLPAAIPGAKLISLFSPEHGLFGRQDSTSIKTEVDTATGLSVTSLYGAHDSDRRPSHEQLKDLDAVVIDIQDAGVRFYTYETILGYFLEAAGREARDYNHKLTIVVLDRPTPINGIAVEGPVSDPDHTSYTDYMPEPVRHGMTMGELARFFDGEKSLGAPLLVVKMRGWSRPEFFDQTGLHWINPSPNLRNVTEEVLYPGVAFLEGTNVSVGRGTATPFEWFGAGSSKDPKTGQSQPAWFNARAVADALNARHIPGVHFEPTTMAVAEDSFHYPYHGQTFGAVHIDLTDRNALNSPELGVELLSVLHRLYPEQFKLTKAGELVANRATLEAIMRGEDPRVIASEWAPALHQFDLARQRYLLY